jgi:hypothetical protein
MVDLLAFAAGAEPEPSPGLSPDELLLEMMDLVQLSFPTAIASATLTFRANDDGSRPALTNLDATSAKGAPSRPPLGHTDAEVLDTLNHLLGELAAATDTQGGVRVLDGVITITANADGGRDVALREHTDSGDELVMTRTYDASELRWLLFTPELFASLARSEADEVAAGARLREALAGTTRFDIDMKTATITFSGPGREPVPWRFELLGSWLERSGRFRWGWSNDQVDPKLTRRVDAIRVASTGPGLRVFVDAEIGGPDEMFSRVCRSVGARIGAYGVYRAPFSAVHGRGSMYLALFTA